MISQPSLSQEDRKTRRKAIAALICLIAVAVLNKIWLWGVLFAVWAAGGMVTGRAYLLEELSHKKFPLLCWGINIVWFAIGLSMIVEPFLTGSPPNTTMQN